MFDYLKKSKGESYCAIAADYKQRFGPLLQAYEVANSHNFDIVRGAQNGLEILFLNRDPRWCLTIQPHKIVAAFLPTSLLFESEFRTDTLNLVHRILQKLEVDTITRVGVLVSTFSPNSDEKFEKLSSEFSQALFRPPILAALSNLRGLDGYARMIGTDDETGLSLTFDMTTLSRDQAFAVMQSGAINLLKQLDTPDDRQFIDFVKKASVSPLMIEVDSGSPEIATEKFRSQVERQLEYIDQKIGTISSLVQP